jgi:ParB family chromosome partitioning protein
MSQNVVQKIAIDRINILNPRVRNQKIFADMVENITRVGLKRPITVTPCTSVIEGKDYDLVCGQGRMEAFAACGQTHIPAIVIDATEENALIMSLVENLARRNYRSIDLFNGIKLLSEKGYDAKTIASKTGLSPEYTSALLLLLENGEERLLAAVEAGHIPVSVAKIIATSPDDEQLALQEAYEKHQLKGNRLFMAKKLIEARKQLGKSLRGSGNNRNNGNVTTSAQDIVKNYQKEIHRMQMLKRKYDDVTNSLLTIRGAMKQLLKEENFTTLLRAETLSTLPKPVALMLEIKE